MPTPKNIGPRKIDTLRGIGAAMCKRLDKFNIQTLHDLLCHLPARYEDRSLITPVRELRVSEAVVVEGLIAQQAPLWRNGRPSGLSCSLQDAQGDTLSLEWSRITSYHRGLFAKGKTIRCYGVIRRNSRGLCMYYPEYIDASEHNPNALTPIYPSTAGISQFLWRRIMNEALKQLSEQEPHDVLPVAPETSSISQAESNTIPLREAFDFLHAPSLDQADEITLRIEHYKKRLAYEELLAHYLNARSATRLLQEQTATAFKRTESSIEQDFVKSLPFQLTNAQQRVIQEILHDLEGNTAMRRLLQGDVSCGKTVVAAIVALRVISNKAQVAVMAPTEILSHQHYHNFESWFKPLSLKVAHLRSGQNDKQRTEMLHALSDGAIDLIVGTHTLLQKDVQFKHLGLNIIDEQHLFGVHQRLLMQQKTTQAIGNSNPHQLIMSATPIPRTLFMIHCSNLDQSVIDEMPANRIPVQTALVSQKRRMEVIEKVRRACADGKRGYWICPFIDQSEAMDAQAVSEVASDLSKMMPELRIDSIHSKRDTAEREQIMSKFQEGQIDLLIATTIVGTGIDVPDTTLMVIENAERLGLAQLHQLRGRIGRGTEGGSCVLIYGACGEQSMRRLKILRQYNDGYTIALKDLQTRGPGEVLGTAQSGNIRYRVADLRQDMSLMESIRQYGKWLEDTHPECAKTLVYRWNGSGKIYNKC